MLSTRRLRRIGPVDADLGQVTASAGVTLGELQTTARDAGWCYDVDLAARDSATVGGTVATNAGGLHVFAYGDTRAQVVGLEAVLASGEVIGRLDGLTKDNAGFDLPRLLIGSEGTLGIVTAARLRLARPRPEVCAALIGVESVGAALDVMGRLRSEISELCAAEIMFRNGLELVCSVTGLADPMDAPHPAYLMVEIAAREDREEDLLGVLDSCPAVEDAVLARSLVDRTSLWQYRERHTEALNSLAPPLKFDISLPPSGIAELTDVLPVAIEAVDPDAQLVVFGHLGDGNLHINVIARPDAEQAITQLVLESAVALGGSIAAEHGIGVAKAPWLELSRNHAEIAAMREVKRALDPLGLLNPGVLLQRGDRPTDRA